MVDLYGSSDGRQSMKLWSLTLAGLTFGAAAVGCGSGGGGGGDNTPAAITIVAGNRQDAEVGTKVPIDPVARVTNAAGEPLEGVNVIFAVVAGGGSVAEPRTVTNSDGEATPGSWTLGSEPGANTLTASTNGLLTIFRAVGTVPGPVAIDIREGNDQTGRLEQDLPIDPRVVVVDEDGDPFAGETVTFTPPGGSGTVGTASVVTDENGEASTTWALGQTGTNLMEATAGQLTATFFAIGTDSDYEVEIVFLNPETTISQKNAFGSAAGRWMEVVTGDLTDVMFPSGIDATLCGVDDPSSALRTVVDDLLLYASLVPIDGPGGTIGAAFPCFIRAALPDAPLTIVGVAQFDTSDLGLLEGLGLLDDVILHEMAHVLGFGGLWSQDPLDFLQSPSLPNDPGADTHFNGPNAVAAFDDLPGGPWIPPTSATSRVPVENTEGDFGERDNHWRESTFVSELMTPFISPVSNPLSTVTIESLRDLGYEVDITQADPYSLEGENGQPRLQSGFLLLDDVLRMPMHLVDAKGNIVGVTDP
jgi:hypothetical protein